MSSPRPLVLASASPRRRQLLTLLGIPHVVEPAGVEESPAPSEPPETFALRAAREKASEVAARLPGSAVLAADTVVAVGNTILGKPSDPRDAVRMLRSLSGKSHWVHTGVALAWDGSVAALLDSTRVVFRELEEKEIQWYVASGEPLDKAGAYALQGRGGLFVAAVYGSPHTVVGLPVHRLPELFAAAGLDFTAWLRESNPRLNPRT